MILSQSQLSELTSDAFDAFWQVIVRRFPEATTGDLSPLTTIVLERAAEDAIAEWVGNNVNTNHD